MTRSAPAPAPMADPSADTTPAATELRRRAVAIWPRLDPAALRRCGNDAACVAAIVERRSSLPFDAIVAILSMPRVSEDEVSTWFG